MALPEAEKKTPLILKDFFLLKFGANEQSMTWGEKSHEDGLRKKSLIL
jgi:hypothetical protein